MHSDLQLPGFRIVTCLWRKAGRAAYHARSLSDDAEVCIETLDTAYPDRRQVAMLSHEASISRRLQGINGIPWPRCLTIRRAAACRWPRYWTSPTGSPNCWATSMRRILSTNHWHPITC